MEKKKRYRPPSWLPTMFWGTAFAIHRFNTSLKSKETFFRYLRETEKYIWVKLTYPPGHYSVRENSMGNLEVAKIELAKSDFTESQIQEFEKQHRERTQQQQQERVSTKTDETIFNIENRFFTFRIVKDKKNKDTDK